MKKTILTVLILLLTALNLSAATLQWDASTGATSYELNYRMIGVSDWIELGTVDTSYDLNSLSLAPNTRYEFQIFSTDGVNTSDGSDIIRWTFEGPPMIIEMPVRPQQLIINFGD